MTKALTLDEARDAVVRFLPFGPASNEKVGAAIEYLIDVKIAIARQEIAALGHRPIRSLSIEGGVGRMGLVIEFHQHDWIPGWAAFAPDATTPEGRAFCVLNVGAFLGSVATGHVEPADLPYFIAESMMHEVMHALEQWAGVEFNEERVEALIEKYRQSVPTSTEAGDG